jgi:hypothetical protein
MLVAVALMLVKNKLIQKLILINKLMNKNEKNVFINLFCCFYIN